MKQIFDGNRPLAEASTLPSSTYLSSEYYDKELKQVFGKEWHWACRTEQVNQPGQWITTQIGNESIVVSRDSEGILRAFSNVCRHRAAKVCRVSQGQSTRLRCQYHGWTYDLAGNLKTAPEFQGVSHFNCEQHSLPSFQVEELGPWLFVCLASEAPNFLAQWKPFLEQSESFQIDQMKFVKRVEYPLNCNWKVFVDNYLDGGYHINTLHPDLAGLIPYSDYRSEIFEKSSLQTAPLKSNLQKESAKVRKGTAQYWWLYPNLMINLYEGVMDLNLVIPEGPNNCRVVFDFYFKDISDLNQPQIEQSLKIAHQIQMEDQGICEEVQEGLQSAFYTSGRFSVLREQTAYHFHQLLAREAGLFE